MSMHVVGCRFRKNMPLAGQIISRLVDCFIPQRDIRHVPLSSFSYISLVLDWETSKWAG